MGPIGYSTGAVAFGDFRSALARLRNAPIQAIELSALRNAELRPLLEAISGLQLSSFKYVSIHAPSTYGSTDERNIVDALLKFAPKHWPIVLHPDAIRDFTAWRELGAQACVENMDKRKPIGRTASELSRLFDKLPDASFCLDVGHARQVDPTMCVALMIIREHGHRLKQIHVSEVDTQSRHHRLTLAGELAFQKLAPALPHDAVVIIESLVTPREIVPEIQKVKKMFDEHCLAVFSD